MVILGTLNTGVDMDGFWAGVVLAFAGMAIVIVPYMGLRLLKRIFGA